ncbi:MAG: GDP-mannose 4,6-dehydratase [Kiritimatiellaeota bacterium]|nr:GDP-mannose 4,6-dehydratase [Kiritimatiellota bacterium]
MRILITGARGFAGRHVVAELLAHGHAPLLQDVAPARGAESFTGWTGDLRDAAGIRQAVRQLQPEVAVHLAGLSFVPRIWAQPVECFSVNVLGTLNLLEAFRLEAPRARLLVVSSAEVYGRPAGSQRLTEASPLQPLTPYAVSKAAAEQMALLYAGHHGLPVLVARPKNHIGPGQARHFVAATFAEQLARLVRDRAEPVLRVGNLESERDFADVRDVARAYRLLLERGRAGEAYNIAAARLVSIRAILEILCREAGVQPRLEADPERWRPADLPAVLAIDKIRRDTGWQPEIPLEQSLRELYRDIRDSLNAAI